MVYIIAGKKNITKEIESALFNLFFTKYSHRCALEVEVYNNNGVGISNYKRVDMLSYDNQDWYAFEIKTSIQDFSSKNGHNFIANRNYYVVPKELYEKIKHKIPKHIGCYIFEWKIYTKMIEKTKDESIPWRDRYNYVKYNCGVLTCIKSCKRVDSRLDIQQYAEKQKYSMITATNSTINRLLKNLREKDVDNNGEK